MYGAGECFAYGATKDAYFKTRAVKAFEALKFLMDVTQGGTHLTLHYVVEGSPVTVRVLAPESESETWRDDESREARVTLGADEVGW